MTDKISGYGRNGVDISSARARGADRVARTNKGQAADAADKAVADAVRLTDTASQLKRIESRLASVPDVDQARVDAMRARLARGDYRVDAERLAERLARFERSLT